MGLQAGDGLFQFANVDFVAGVKTHGNNALITEAKDAAGKVIARSWCEAVVQRMPDYLDPADSAETEHKNLTSNVNQTFGRRFQIITFQWLPRKAV